MTLLCNTDPNWFVFRVTLEENVATMFGKLAQQWMKSQSPHIILESQVLLVDSTCPSFVDSVDSSSCITAAPQLAEVVVGTFFGAVILGFLLTVAVLAVVLLMLWIFKREKYSAFFSSKGPTNPSLEEEMSIQEYEAMDIESNDHYEYPQSFIKKEDPIKKEEIKVAIDSGYENPLELVSVSSKNRSPKKYRSWKKKEPQVATYNNAPMVTTSSQKPLTIVQPHPTNVLHKQEHAIANDYTTEKEYSPIKIEATEKGGSGHGSKKGSPYEPLTLPVSESAPTSQQHSYQTKQQKKKPKAKLQSKQQTQDAVPQPSPALSQPLLAVTLPSTATQQPLVSGLQPAVGAVAKPSLTREKKDTQGNLQIQSEASKTNQISATMSEPKEASPAPTQGQKKPMHPKKKHENVTLEADQVKSGKKAKTVVTSTSDLAHTHRGQGTKDKQASTSVMKQPSAFQVKTDRTPASPENAKKDKKKNFQR